MKAETTETELEPMLRSLRNLGFICWGFGGLCLLATLFTASPVLKDLVASHSAKPTTTVEAISSLPVAKVVSYQSHR